MASVEELQQALNDQTAAFTEMLTSIAADVSNLKGNVDPALLDPILQGIHDRTAQIQGVDADPDNPPPSPPEA